MILIKRGNEANLPVLSIGELAVTLDTKKLFIGTDSGNLEFTRFGYNVKSILESGVFSSSTSSFDIIFEDFDSNADALMVYIGGLIQTKGTDYSVSNNTINKIGDPWESGYVYDVIILKNRPLYTQGDKIPLAHYESRTTLLSDSDIASIGISEYNKDTDILLAFLNGDKLLKDVDFFIDNDTQISKTAGTWSTGDNLDFLVIKSKSSLDDTYDGRVLLEKSVSIESFEDSLQSIVNNIIEDEITGDKYIWTARNGVPYLKVVEVI